MFKSLTLLFLFVTLSVFGQYKDDFQSDSVYKANKVRVRTTKIEPSSSVSTIRHVFDQQGKLMEEILTDNSNPHSYQYKIIYQYDESGFLSGWKYKSFTSNFRKECKMFYRVGVLDSCTCIDRQGNVSNTFSYQNNGSIVIERQYKEGKVHRTQTSEYDVFNNKTRFYGFELGDGSITTIKVPDGKAVEFKNVDLKWDYVFMNIYENGRLSSQIRLENGESKEKEDFYYDVNGLLIQTYNNRRPKGSQTKFAYEFW